MTEDKNYLQERLLRRMLLDHETGNLPENLIDMNAAFVFDSPVSTDGNPLKEQEMLLRLKKIAPSDFRLKRYLLLLLFLAGLAALFLVLSQQPGNPPAKKQPTPLLPEKLKQPADTIPGSKTHSDAITNDQQITITEQPINPDPTGQVSNKKRTSATFSTSSTLPPKPYSPPPLSGLNPDETGSFPAPSPEFKAAATPSDYHSKPVNLKLAGNCTLFGMVCFNDSTITGTAYTGMPFKEKSLPDMLWLNYAELSNPEKAILPASLLWYLDPEKIGDGQYDGSLPLEVKKRLQQPFYFSQYAGSLPTEVKDRLLQPFYFRKYEVTNAEYREFINWVKASNGFEEIPVSITRYDTIEAKENDKTAKLRPDGSRYFTKPHTEHLQDFNEVYRYRFFNQSKALLNVFPDGALNVFPDTNAWVSDYAISYNEPMRDVYFWHPAFSKYPVVGVSWYQALAYLDWKTATHQKELDKKGIPLKVNYQLPGELHWELATLYRHGNAQVPFDPVFSTSQKWLSDLAVSPANDPAWLNRQHPLKMSLTSDVQHQGNFIVDGAFFTTPANMADDAKMEKAFLHLDPAGISGMGSNVSEWMQENYQEHRKPFLEKRWSGFSEDDAGEMALMTLEKLYNESNHSNGYLVKGANWYDERYGDKTGLEKNFAGYTPWRFIDPAAQHSTVGFRYILVVEPKE